MKKHDLILLTGLEEKELYKLLGVSLSENTFGIVPPNSSISRKIGIAKSWYQSQKKELTEYLCKSKIINNIKKNSDSKKMEIIATIADVLVQKWTSYPVFILSTLIVNEGINKICNE